MEVTTRVLTRFLKGRLARMVLVLILIPVAGLLASAQIPPIVPLAPAPGKDTPLRPAPFPVPAVPGAVTGLGPGSGIGSPKSALGALEEERKEAMADDEVFARRARLQAELEQLLSLLASRPQTGMAVPQPPPPKPKPIPPLIEGQAVDGLRKGMNLFRDNDFLGALFAFQNIDVNSVSSREDRAFIQYMRGCCYRRLNRMNDAANTFRDVADAREDDFLADCAVWQLSMIRQAQDIEGRIQQLRARTASP